MFGFINGLLRRSHRERLRFAKFPSHWLEILKTNVPLYTQLSASDQDQLKWRVQVFLAEKRFEGCGGLTITDEMIVTIAGHACLLLLRRDTDFYPELYSILLYPSAFLVPVKRDFGDAPGIVHEGVDALCGEAWPTGAIVLSWDEVCKASLDDRDGTNVTVHEFAHLLDMEGGAADGTPILRNHKQYMGWVKVFEAEFQYLRRARRRGRSTVLDKYGTEHPAEFFAVATEAFFENPIALKQQHSALYSAIKGYYQQDPVMWLFRKK
tara:strand:+ start:79 stop:876 length:798 start_codon:yes stop_codon:yes gene_type:complete